MLELEGACLYVHLDEVGERYPVLWPLGTRWDGDAQTVVTPEGEALSMGEEVYGRPAYAACGANSAVGRARSPSTGWSRIQWNQPSA